MDTGKIDIGKLPALPGDRVQPVWQDFLVSYNVVFGVKVEFT